MKTITLLLFIMLSTSLVSAEPVFNQQNCVRAIIGEAGNQGYEGMVHLASGLLNRGTLKGVYGFKAKHVDKEPAWVWKMAKRAYLEAKSNRTHTGDHWENIKAFGKPYWVDSMEKVFEYKDHVFYKPKGGE